MMGRMTLREVRGSAGGRQGKGHKGAREVSDRQGIGGFGTASRTGGEKESACQGAADINESVPKGVPAVLDASPSLGVAVLVQKDQRRLGLPKGITLSNTKGSPEGAKPSLR